MSVRKGVRRQRSPARRTFLRLVIVATASLVGGYGVWGAAQTPTNSAGTLAGMASLSGTVESPSPFEAAPSTRRGTSMWDGSWVAR